MLDDVNARLEEAKQHRARRAYIIEALPKARDYLGEERFQLEQLEAALDGVHRDIDALQSLTLQSLLDGVLGRKQRKLNQLTEEQTALHSQVDECADKVESLEQAIADLETELEPLGDAEETYRRLFEEKERIVRDGQDERATRLREISIELEAARVQKQKIDKAVHSGKHAVERLHSATNTLGRASHRSVGTQHGVLVAGVVNTITRSSSEPVLRRAREGLTRFCEDAARIDFDTRSERDAEIARLVGAMDGGPGQLRGPLASAFDCDMSVAGPLMEQIHNVMGLIKTKLDECNAYLAELENERQSLVEGA